jgi:hypothetical protein
LLRPLLGEHATTIPSPFPLRTERADEHIDVNFAVLYFTTIPPPGSFSGLAALLALSIFRDEGERAEPMQVRCWGQLSALPCPSIVSPLPISVSLLTRCVYLTYALEDALQPKPTAAVADNDHVAVQDGSGSCCFGESRVRLVAERGKRRRLYGRHDET